MDTTRRGQRRSTTPEQFGSWLSVPGRIGTPPRARYIALRCRRHSQYEVERVFGDSDAASALSLSPLQLRPQDLVVVASRRLHEPHRARRPRDLDGVVHGEREAVLAVESE